MRENCALSGVLQACHLLDGFNGKGQGTTAGSTAHDAGIVVLEEAAGHITGDIQTGDRLIVAVLGLAILGDGDALHTAQQRGTQPAAVEGSGADGAQTISGLAEVLVVLLVVQLIVAVNSSKEGVLGLTGEAQLVGQLFDGVAENRVPAATASSTLPWKYFSPPARV